MRAIGFIPFTAVALGAHCPETPWDYEPIPDEGPRSAVYFDSGAVVQARLVNGEQIRGALPRSFTPGREELVVCEEELAPCGDLDGSRGRIVPLTQIERLEFPETAAGKGAQIGYGLGLIGALVYGVDDDDVELFFLSGLSGGLVGGLIALPFTDWITVAERSDADTLRWIPQVPELIPLPSSGYEFATACARGNALPSGDFVAVVDWERTAYFTEVLRAWEVDTVEHRMIPTSTDDVRCRNEVWEGPVTVVPYEVESEALAFTPPPSKARIYIYQTLSHHSDKFRTYGIEIDGVAIGRTVPGTYLVADVGPGLHRVRNQETRHDVLLDAAADSAYFVKVWHKPGFWVHDYGHVARMDRTEGRGRIRAGRMLTATSPTATQGPYQDVRVIGLVEVPRLFGRRDPQGPPGVIAPAPFEPISLHALPSADSRLIGTVTAPDQLDAREYDYEALAAVAYEARDSAYLVRVRSAAGVSYGWLTPPHAGTFHPLGDLVREGLAYLTEEWDGRVFASPRDTIATTKLEPGSDFRDIVVSEVKETEGTLWLQIEILTRGRCERAEVETSVSGWILAHAVDGKPNAWFYSRGC